MSDHTHSAGADDGGPGGAAGQHLTEEEVETYYFNKPPFEEESATRDHLVRCRDCASLLLDIAAFYGAADAAGRPAEAAAAEDEAVWVGLRDRLPSPPARETRRPRPSLVPVWGWLGGLSPSARWAYGSAALLFVVSVVLAAMLASTTGEKRELAARLSEEREARHRSEAEAETAASRRATELNELEEARKLSAEERARAEEERARAAELEHQLAEARREGVRPSRSGGSGPGTWVNAPVLLLATLKVRDGVSSPGDALKINLRPGTDLFTFAIQDPSPEKGYASYAIEIEDEHGRKVVDEVGLRSDSPDRGRWLTIALRKGRLRDGQYRIKIFGIKDGERTEEGVRDILLKYN